MVGGTVIDVCPMHVPVMGEGAVPAYKLHVAERLPWGDRRLDMRNAASVIVSCPTAQRGPRPGDSIWWQGDTAYWTPKEDGCSRPEVALHKFGPSGSAWADARVGERS